MMSKNSRFNKFTINKKTCIHAKTYPMSVVWTVVLHYYSIDPTFLAKTWVMIIYRRVILDFL